MTADGAGTYKVHGPLTELTRARIYELTREPEAVFWVFVFPIVLAAVLGLAFRSKPPEPLPIAVVAGPRAEARLAALQGPDLKPTIVQESEASLALARGRVVLVVSGGRHRVVYLRPDPARESYRADWPSTPRFSAPRAAPTPSRRRDPK